jgi:hypothetical protein
MKKTFIEIWKEYIIATNPVTRWSLRQCIIDRIYRKNMHIALFYMYNLSRDD